MRVFSKGGAHAPPRNPKGQGRMNTQELIERIQTFSFYRSRLGSSGEKLLKEAAQALTASQERERVLREALMRAAGRLKIIADIGSYEENSPVIRPWELEARQALQSTEQQGTSSGRRPPP